MKKILSTLVLLCISLVLTAQDVIVKKDGSTIQSNVIEVSTKEVKYKKYNNPDGPTYVLEVSELQRIEYKNGEKEQFDAVSTNSNSVPFVSPNSGPTDSQLLKMYSNSSRSVQKAKTQRIIGYIGGSVLIAGGIVLATTIDRLQKGSYEKEPEPGAVAGGISAMAVGAIGGTWLVLNANHKLKKLRNLSVASLPFTEVQLFDKHVTANVDIIRDNFTKQQTLGLGLSCNF